MSNTIHSRFSEANVSESDKIGRHGYHRFYPVFLQHLTEKEGINLLEIGFHLGNSITLWNNYFNKPNIYAIDIKESVSHPLLKEYYKVDQSSVSELQSFANTVKTRFDFILDDGSHAPVHQWNTFIEFFPLLKEGGYYLIEDVETSFWGKSNVYGYAIDTAEFSLFKKLEALPFIINKEFIKSDLKMKWGLTTQEYAVLQDVEMYSIGHNCLMFVKKDHQHFENFYRSFEQYPLKGNIDSKRNDIFYRISNHPRFKKLFGKNG